MLMIMLMNKKAVVLRIVVMLLSLTMLTHIQCSLIVIYSNMVLCSPLIFYCVEAFVFFSCPTCYLFCVYGDTQFPFRGNHKVFLVVLCVNITTQNSVTEEMNAIIEDRDLIIIKPRAQNSLQLGGGVERSICLHFDCSLCLLH